MDELFDTGTSFPFWYYESRDFPKIENQPNYILSWQDTLVERFEISDIDFSNLNNFLVEVDFDITNTESISFRISLGDIQFGGCPKCTVSTVEIKKASNILYESERLGLPSNYKLSILKREKIVSFFFNDQFLHAVEFDLFDGNEFNFRSSRDAINKLNVNVLEF